MRLWNWYMSLSNIRKFQLGAPVVMLVFLAGIGVYQLIHHKGSAEPLVFSGQFDPSIYHQPGSNHESAIKNGNWTLIYKFQGKIRTFPRTGTLSIPEPIRDNVYEDKDTVFQVQWNRDREGARAERLEEDEEVWGKVWDGDKYPDYDLVGLVRIYKEKRRTFKVGSFKERILLTMPEDADRDKNMWEMLANSQPTPTPIILMTTTPVIK
jgi:hypothetical protein